MKKFLVLCCLGFFTLRALAVEANHVKYVGGTVPGMSIGALGTIDVSGTTLVFESLAHKVSIPYASIESFEHSTEVARHLGVLPAIVAALIKPRQRRHFIGISYRDQSADPESQVLVLEVPKDMTRALQRVLATRAPRHAEEPTRPCTSS